MQTALSAMLEEVRARLEPLGDPARAAPMAAYMKGQFPFLGIATPARVAALKPLWQGWKPDAEALLKLTEALWALPEREYQYAAFGALERHWRVLESRHLEGLCRLVAGEKAWWDTVDSVDGIAGHLVGRDPALVGLMDAFAVNDNLWLRRVAIQHQLGFRANTDGARLFRYALLNADHQSFWIRKSLGWALREYAKTNPEVVRAFLETHGERFSSLTRREALKHLS